MVPLKQRWIGFKSLFVIFKLYLLRFESVYWLIGCLGVNGPLRQFLSLYWPISDDERVMVKGCVNGVLLHTALMMKGCVH